MISGEPLLRTGKNEMRRPKKSMLKINERRAERVKKLLPRWYLTYGRFRFFSITLIVFLTFFMLTSLSSAIGLSSTNLIFVLILVYFVAAFADRAMSYFAFRRVPIEVYYQEENHY